MLYIGNEFDLVIPVNRPKGSPSARCLNRASSGLARKISSMSSVANRASLELLAVLCGTDLIGTGVEDLQRGGVVKLGLRLGVSSFFKSRITDIR